MPTDAKPSQRQPRWRPHFQSIVSFSVACEVVSTVSHAASTLEPRSISQTSLSNSLTQHSLGREGGCKEMCASLVATKMQRAGPQAPTGTATAHCRHGVCRGYPRGRKKLEKSRTISQQLQSDLHSVHAAAAERQAREEERTAFREPALLARGGEVREQGKSRCLRHQSCLGPTSSHRAAQCASSGTQGSRNDGANPSREFSAFFRRFLPTSSAF